MLQGEHGSSVGGAGVCYTTAYFRPWFFPVTAQYNDYGSIENIEKDWNSDYMFESFKRWLKEGRVKILGDDAEINSPDIEKFTKLDDVFDCVERGALVLELDSDKFDGKKWVPTTVTLKIGMFMVIESVFNALVAECRRNANLPRNDYYKKRAAEDHESALEAINKARASFGKGQNEFENMLFSMKIDRLLGDLIEEHYAFKHYKGILFNPKKVSVDDFFIKLNETHDICTVMSYLRKLWIPQAGQGSQSEELSFNVTLANAILAHAAARDVENEKWRKEDEAAEKKYAAEQAAKKAKE